MGLFKKGKNQIPEIQASTTPPPSPAITQQTPMPQAPEPIAPQAPEPTSPPPSIPHPELSQPAPKLPKISPQIAPQPSIVQQPTVPQPSVSNNISPVTTELSYKEGTAVTPEQPFFVRIDKFSETKDNFHKINQKIKEMEEILSNLESTKNEEERELDLWKQDMNEMKSLLSNIDKEIFNKI
jgi:hypothetical protein